MNALLTVNSENFAKFLFLHVRSFEKKKSSQFSKIGKSCPSPDFKRRKYVSYHYSRK